MNDKKKFTAKLRKIKCKTAVSSFSFTAPVSAFSLRLSVFVKVFLVLLFSSCSGIAQKGGEILEGSAFSAMELASYSSGGKRKETNIELKELSLRDGEWVTGIHSSQWPGFTLRGGIAAGNGSFELLEARILSSHTDGWNEFNLDILGMAFFENPKKTDGVLRIEGNVERVQISSGSIRLKSSRLSGDAALTALRNRRERILALIEWMTRETESGGENAVFQNQKEFEKYWKGRLFPERVSKSKWPVEYTKKNAKWRRADGVKWNLTYTENIFPEGLWEYRNSGAMLRDWEEALPWIFMEYSWDFILSSFNDTHLYRIK